MDSGNRNGAEVAVQHAIKIGEQELQKAEADRKLGQKKELAPAWIAEAHRLAGDIANLGADRKSAINHYQRYLEFAPRAAMDRSTVKKLLQSWGQTGK